MKSNNFSIEFINANEVSAVANISNSLAKGQNTQVTIFKSLDDDMKKGRGENTNPFMGRVAKREVYGGWVVGTNYSSSCEKASNRSGGSGEFQAKPSWHTYYNDFFETDKKTRSKFYLQLQRADKQSSRVETTYYLDGKELSKNSAEFAEVAKWFKAKPAHKQSSSQVESGISAENERHYILLTLANIERIKQGERAITIAVSKVAESVTSASK